MVGDKLKVAAHGDEVVLNEGKDIVREGNAGLLRRSRHQRALSFKKQSTKSTDNESEKHPLHHAFIHELRLAPPYRTKTIHQHYVPYCHALGAARRCTRGVIGSDVDSDD
jgi:hypothetical protein